MNAYYNFLRNKLLALEKDSGKKDVGAPVKEEKGVSVKEEKVVSVKEEKATPMKDSDTKKESTGFSNVFYFDQLLVNKLLLDKYTDLPTIMSLPGGESKKCLQAYPLVLRNKALVERLLTFHFNLPKIPAKKWFQITLTMGSFQPTGIDEIEQSLKSLLANLQA